MKRFCFVLLFVFLSVFVFAENLQRTYSHADKIYKDVNSLALRAGKIGTSGVSPVTAAELLVVLERINVSDLSDYDRKVYYELYDELSGGDGYLFEYKKMALDASLKMNMYINVADYKDFDFSGKDKPAPIRDRKNELLVPFRISSVNPRLFNCRDESVE